MSEVEVKKLGAALQRQPLFHLSLYSKEVFHSNFLGWVREAHPLAAPEALDPWVPEAWAKSWHEAATIVTSHDVEGPGFQTDLAIVQAGLGFETAKAEQTAVTATATRELATATSALVSTTGRLTHATVALAAIAAAADVILTL